MSPRAITWFDLCIGDRCWKTYDQDKCKVNPDGTFWFKTGHLEAVDLEGACLPGFDERGNGTKCTVQFYRVGRIFDYPDARITEYSVEWGEKKMWVTVKGALGTRKEQPCSNISIA